MIGNTTDNFSSNINVDLDVFIYGKTDSREDTVHLLSAPTITLPHPSLSLSPPPIFFILIHCAALYHIQDSCGTFSRSKGIFEDCHRRQKVFQGLKRGVKFYLRE